MMNPLKNWRPYHVCIVKILLLLLPVPKVTQNSYCTLLWRARGTRA